MYRVQIDSAAFIKECIAEINRHLQFKNVSAEFENTTGRNEFDTVRRMQLVKDADPAKIELTLLDTVDKK